MFFEVTENTFDVALDIRYADDNNFTGAPVYKKPLCFLRNECRKPLEEAIKYAHHLGYKFKIFDGFRPQEAQELLWRFCPDDNYIMNPTKGSVHTRGIAIDLTLMDEHGVELDMGTPFDDFTTKSHCDAILTPEQNKNRYILLGIMSAAGWDFFKNEWWHFQLFNSRSYDLIMDNHGIM